jgi:uncharacterized protein
MPQASDAIAQAGLLDGPDPEVNASLREARFVDHHVHGILRGRLTPGQLVAGLSETDRAEAAASAGIEHQLGIAVRRWTAPLLGLESQLPAEEWLATRALVDNEDAAARLLPAAGFAALYLDTGYRSSQLVSTDEMAGLTGAPARPIVRLEALAEEVAAGGISATDFAPRFREALEQAVGEAVGLKSILAYRCGLDVEPTAPSGPEVEARVGAWMTAAERGGSWRLADPVIERFLLWAGVETGLPIQFHTGYGDSDLHLQHADPLLLTDFIRAVAGRCQVLLLHTYPFHRHAGYLTQMFEHVAMDIGLGVNHSGVQSEQLIAESLEVAPLRRILFSSDAWGLPELHLLGSWLFRRGLSRVLGRWVRAGDWSAADAVRAIELIGSENARRIYAD